MSNRRDAIRMSDAEIGAFIEAQKSLQVGTLERDGSIHLSTLWFAVVDDRIVFETYTKSQKIRNLQRDPRITVLLEDGDVYEELRGVMIKGTATLVDESESVSAMALEVLGRNQPEVPEAAREEAARFMSTRRTVVIVEPTRTISWDHTKL